MKAIIGPTLIDLEMTAHTDARTMSYIFPARAVGGMTGAILGGVLIKHANRWLLMGTCLLVSGVGNIFVPWIPNILALMIYFTGLSLMNSVFETGESFL